jgi:hypothetical protein
VKAVDVATVATQLPRILQARASAAPAEVTAG